MRFRKKPVVIDAIQFTGENEDFIFEELGVKNRFTFIGPDGDRQIGINTLEGSMVTRIGDWVIKGVEGEFYPCKSSIFEATYEPES